MIEMNSKMFIDYLTTLVDRTFAVLCLYEEENEGLFKYIQSLIYELNGLKGIVEEIKTNADFITILATFESLSEDALFFDNHEVFRREVLKCITIIKRIRKRIRERIRETK